MNTAVAHNVGTFSPSMPLQRDAHSLIGLLNMKRDMSRQMIEGSIDASKMSVARKRNLKENNQHRGFREIHNYCT